MLLEDLFIITLSEASNRNLSQIRFIKNLLGHITSKEWDRNGFSPRV